MLVIMTIEQESACKDPLCRAHLRLPKHFCCFRCL